MPFSWWWHSIRISGVKVADPEAAKEILRSVNSMAAAVAAKQAADKAALPGL